MAHDNDGIMLLNVIFSSGGISAFTSFIDGNICFIAGIEYSVRSLGNMNPYSETLVITMFNMSQLSIVLVFVNHFALHV